MSVKGGKSPEAVSCSLHSWWTRSARTNCASVGGCRDSSVCALTVLCTEGCLPSHPSGMNSHHGELKKYNGEALGHTHTNHRSTPESTRDPNLL